MSQSKKIRFISTITLAATFGFASQPLVFAKIKPFSPWKPKSVEAAFVKGISGEATLTVQQKIALPSSENSVPFQDGKLTDNIEFFQTPRCYLHFKAEAKNTREVDSGKTLKISKIDNIYAKGSVHVTFWFDEDSLVSDLSCVTNYDHTLTSSELKETLGNHFAISFTKSIEKEALFNTAPRKNALPLTETSPSEYSLHSARLILGS
jgi:hypothetical protein